MLYMYTSKVLSLSYIQPEFQICLAASSSHGELRKIENAMNCNLNMKIQLVNYQYGENTGFLFEIIVMLSPCEC